jgi:hypothetical protein
MICVPLSKAYPILRPGALPVCDGLAGAPAGAVVGGRR